MYGADCAVGFLNAIYASGINHTWTPAFWGQLASGYNVGNSLAYAAEQVYWTHGNYWGYDSYIWYGSVQYPQYVTITPARYGN